MTCTLKARLFVAVEDNGRDDSWLIATSDRDTLAELHERRRVGVYVLEKIVVLANTTAIVERPKTKGRVTKANLTKKRKKP